MLSINQLKFIRSLHQSKFRKLHKLFLAEGPKVVHELLISDYRISTLIGLDSWITANRKMIPSDIETIATSQKELERASTMKNPSEVLAVVHMPVESHPVSDNMEDVVLVLDGISDPGNMGTILRTADWFGIENILCSPDCVEIYNPKVVQASMGSIARVHVEYRNLPSFFADRKKDLPVYGALLEGNNVYHEKLEVNSFLVIGSESHGISADLLPFITHPVSIPANSKQPGIRAESLNASVATAILCSEFRRPSK